MMMEQKSEWFIVERTEPMIAGCEDGRSWAKECGWSPESGKDKEMDSFLELPKECSPADTLVLFTSMKPILNLCPLELKGNKFVFV